MRLIPFSMAVLAGTSIVFGAIALGLGVSHAVQRPSRSELHRLLASSKSIIEELHELDRRIMDLEQRRLAAEHKLEELQRSLKRAEHLIALAEKRSREALRFLRERLLAYRHHSPAVVSRILFGSSDIQKALRRTQLLRVIIRHDRRALERYKRQRQRTVQLREGMLERLHQVQTIEDELGQKQQQLVELRQKRSHMIKVIEESQKLRQRIGAEFVDASQRLSEIVLRKAQKQAQASRGFASKKGSLPRPANGHIAHAFGKSVSSRFNMVTKHNGIDIDAPLGAPVKAVHDGQVAYSGWLEGYGQLIIVAHGEGYFTLYGRLSRIFVDVGDSVESGELIALVGEAGAGGGTGLYFEIRHHGSPVDPMSWIQ